MTREAPLGDGGLPEKGSPAGPLLERAARLQSGGEAFVSNAVVDGRYLLRACMVNFRTQRSDVEALPEIVARVGRAVHAERRPSSLQ